MDKKEGFKKPSAPKKGAEKQTPKPSLRQQLHKTKEKLVRTGTKLKLAKLENKVTNESRELLQKKISLKEFFALNRPDGRMHYITGLKPNEIKPGAECTINLPTSELEYQIGAREFPPQVRAIEINGQLARRHPNQLQGNFYIVSNGRYQRIIDRQHCKIHTIATPAELKAIRQAGRKREKEVMDFLGIAKVKGQPEKLKLTKNSQAAKFVEHLKKEGLTAAQAHSELKIIIREARDHNIDPMIFIALRYNNTINKNNPEAGYNLYGRYIASALSAYKTNHLVRAKKKGTKLPPIIKSGRLTKEGLVFIAHRFNFDGVYTPTDGLNLNNSLKLFGYSLSPQEATKINQQFVPFDRQFSGGSGVPDFDIDKVPYNSQVGRLLFETAKQMQKEGVSAAHCWAWVVKVYKRAGILPPHANEVTFDKVRSIFRGTYYLKHRPPHRRHETRTFMDPKHMGALRTGDMVTICHWRNISQANGQRNIVHTSGVLGHTFLFVRWEDPATKEVALVYDHAHGRPKRNRIRVIRHQTDAHGNPKKVSNITWVIRARMENSI